LLYDAVMDQVMRAAERELVSDLTDPARWDRYVLELRRAQYDDQKICLEIVRKAAESAKHLLLEEARKVSSWPTLDCVVENPTFKAQIKGYTRHIEAIPGFTIYGRHLFNPDSGLHTALDDIASHFLRDGKLIRNIDCGPRIYYGPLDNIPTEATTTDYITLTEQTMVKIEQLLAQDAVDARKKQNVLTRLIMPAKQKPTNQEAWLQLKQTFNCAGQVAKKLILANIEERMLNEQEVIYSYLGLIPRGSAPKYL